MSLVRVERTTDGGYILVAVLGVMLILTGFMAAGSLLVRSALDTVRIGETEGAMTGLTQGGVELTAYQLFVIKAAPAAVDGRRIKFGGGVIAPRLDDEGGKADLNASDPRLLASVFRNAGLDSRTADALLAYVVDLRGASRASSGGPPQAGGGLSAIAQAQDGKTLRGFQSIDQLMDFGDLSRSDMAALRRLLTVFNPDGKINIRSASPTMLGAIPGLTRAQSELILQRRDSASKKEIESLTGTLDQAQAFIKITFGPAFAVRLEATSAKGRKKTINAVLAASKSPNVPYYVLDWWE